VQGAFFRASRASLSALAAAASCFSSAQADGGERVGRLGPKLSPNENNATRAILRCNMVHLLQIKKTIIYKVCQKNLLKNIISTPKTNPLAHRKNSKSGQSQFNQGLKS
jgi:hypothetical protein